MSRGANSMNQKLALALTLALASALPAHAARVVDTGSPNGHAIGAYAFDATDFYAGQVDFGAASVIESIATHILGGGAGETFTVALYTDSAIHLPDMLLYSATATFDADGWNGASALPGWNVGVGSYWVAFEIGGTDNLGSASATGALLDSGAPNPLLHTAFNAGSAYVGANRPLSFGVRVDAVAAVPELEAYTLMLAGLAATALVLRRRKP